VDVSPVYDFGNALSIDAEAVGEPGQRRFRLLVLGSNGSASIWMEKEQLAGIAAWVQEMLTSLEEERPDSAPDVEPLPMPEQADVDFRAVQIALGYAEDQDLFAIQAFDQAIEAENPTPTFRCFISRGQARVLSSKILQLVAAGRPLCPLCDLPIDPSGHQCIRGNGHRQTRIIG
jgi:uncharacterized repeat protein (TIGR03847 family)